MSVIINSAEDLASAWNGPGQFFHIPQQVLTAQGITNLQRREILHRWQRIVRSMIAEEKGHANCEGPSTEPHLLILRQIDEALHQLHERMKSA